MVHSVEPARTSPPAAPHHAYGHRQDLLWRRRGLVGPIFALRGMFVVFCRRPVSGVHSGTGVRRLRKTVRTSCAGIG
jgi:hypothetical protein